MNRRHPALPTYIGSTIEVILKRTGLRLLSPTLGFTTFGFTILAAVLLPSPPVVRGTEVPSQAPAYGKNGTLAVPENYREWVFLSSGIDMVYGPKATAAPGHSAFDNVFVNPEAYRSFLANGTWPDKTMMILEVRAADTNPSINHGGHSQGPVTDVEVHLKDAARFPGGWAFFDVNPSGIGTLIPPPAGCYTCHQDHAAVDTTFVQFYPTLLPIAKTKGTLSAAFLKEFSAAPPSK